MGRYLLLLPLALTAAAATRVSVDYDSRGAARIGWSGAASPGIVAWEPGVAALIEVNGWEVAEFRPSGPPGERRADDPEFGPCLERVFTGVSRDAGRGYALERKIAVLLPDRFPDAAVFRQTFRNAGKDAVHLGRIHVQRLLLDRSRAEPDQASWDFATFQGGAYRWGLDYELIRLRPGFRQSNFQGLDDRTGPEGEGGGIPFIDLWSPVMGVAVAHIEKQPEWVWLPVEVRTDGRVEAALTEKPQTRFGQQEWLQPRETYTTVTSALIFHRGDYYNPLATYSELLRARGINIPRTSPASAYEPYWKSWGFEFDFTQEKILSLLPELKRMDIRVANLDDGWFDWYGDWNPRRAPGKFPGGEADLRAFVARVHREGMKMAVWWYPLGVSPESRMAREHPDLLVMDERGGFPVDDRRVRQFCPAWPPALDAVKAMVKRFVGDWDFDGVYVDSTGLTSVPPCYNPAHRHRTPLESFRAMPRLYEAIDTSLRALKPDPFLEVCICAMPHSPYNMPYYPIANASDPVNPEQMRRRIKVEKALRGPAFCVGDCYQVPLQAWRGSSVPESFESAFGTGAQLTTFYAELTDEQRGRWARWFRLYRELGLSSGEYLNLYDIAFDKPEVHVVRKGGSTYYGMFASYWPRNRKIELRGLDPARTYELLDYVNNRALGRAAGKGASVSVSFKDSLLLRARPVE